MALPKVIYDPGSGNVTLAFARGPQGFRCYWKTRAHDNVATSGVRERVVEGHDLLIEFGMQYLKVAEDLASWAVFVRFALDGGQFDFYPDASLAEHYHCVSDDEGFELVRTAPWVYGSAFHWRIVPDDHAPAGPDVVMRRFYGIAG